MKTSGKVVCEIPSDITTKASKSLKHVNPNFSSAVKAKVRVFIYQVNNIQNFTVYLGGVLSSKKWEFTEN